MTQNLKKLQKLAEISRIIKQINETSKKIIRFEGMEFEMNISTQETNPEMVLDDFNGKINFCIEWSSDEEIDDRLRESRADPWTDLLNKTIQEFDLEEKYGEIHPQYHKWIDSTTHNISGQKWVDNWYLLEIRK